MPLMFVVELFRSWWNSKELGKTTTVRCVLVKFLSCVGLQRRCAEMHQWARTFAGGIVLLPYAGSRNCGEREVAEPRLYE